MSELWSGFEPWQQELGRLFGPGVWDLGYRHPDNQLQPSDAAFSVVSGLVTPTQVFQVVPSHAYSLAILAMIDTTAGAGNVLAVTFGAILSVAGAGTPAGGVAALVADAVSAPFVGGTTLELAMPLGNIPFCIYMLDGTGTSLRVAVTLER